MLDEKEPLASFENLRVEFDTKDGKVVAVEDISVSYTHLTLPTSDLV